MTTATTPSATVTLPIPVLCELRIRLISTAALLRLELWKDRQYWNSEDGRARAAADWCGQQDARADARERSETRLAELDASIVSCTDAIWNAGYVPVSRNEQSMRGNIVLLASNADYLVKEPNADYRETVNWLISEIRDCVGRLDARI